MTLARRIGLAVACVLLAAATSQPASSQTVPDGPDGLRVSDPGRIQSPFFEVALPANRSWDIVSLKPQDAGFVADIGAGRRVLARVASFRVGDSHLRVGPAPGPNSSVEEKVRWIDQVVDKKSAVTVELIIALRERLKADGGKLLFFRFDKNLTSLQPRGYCNGWSAMSIDDRVPGFEGQELRIQHRGRVCFDTSDPAMVSLWYSERAPQKAGGRSGFDRETQAFFDSLRFKEGG